MSRPGVLVVLLTILQTFTAGCKPVPVASVASKPRGQEFDAAAIRLVFLKSAQVDPASDLPPLFVELGRQAVLMALRSDLGLATKDEAVGDFEPYPPDASAMVLHLAVSGSPSEGWRFTAFRLAGAGERIVLWEGSVLPPKDGDLREFYPRLLERLVDPKHYPIAERFRAAGFQPRQREEPLSEVMHVEEADLETANVLRLARTVQRLHAAVWPRQWDATAHAQMARGYARLGLMHAEAHPTWAARALLHAARARQMDGEAPATRTAWCEALTVAQLHAAAEAARGPLSENATPRAKAWQALARYDVATLEALWNETRDPALGQLWVLGLRTSTHVTLQRSRAAAAVVDSEVGALHLFEAMADPSRSERASADRWEQLVECLPTFPGIPAVVLELLEKKQNLPPILGTRVELGRRPQDVREPSWSSLSRHLQDLALGQTAVFMNSRRASESDIGPFDDVQKLLVDHPFSKDLIARMKKEDPSQPDETAWTAAMLARPLLPPANPFVSTYVDQLRLQHQLSPRHPQVLARLLLDDVEQGADWLAKAEPLAADHADLLMSLALFLESEGERERAGAAWKRRAELSPDSSAYGRLARWYRNGNDREGFQATMDRYLEICPDPFEKMQILVGIGEHWLTWGEPARAKPYGRKAALTGLTEGMLFGIKCLTIAGDLEQAEQFAIRFVRSHPNRPDVWLNWCLYTGTGDVDRAWKVVDDYFATLAGEGNAYDCRLRETVALLRGQPEAALAAFTRSWETDPSTETLLHLAVLYAEVGRLLPEPLRDALKRVDAESGTKAQALTARLLLSSDATDPAQLFAQRLQLEQAPAFEGYILGRWMELKGNKDLASACYRFSVAAGDCLDRESVLAAVRLRQLAASRQQ